MRVQPVENGRILLLFRVGDVRGGIERFGAAKQGDTGPEFGLGGGAYEEKGGVRGAVTPGVFDGEPRLADTAESVDGVGGLGGGDGRSAGAGQAVAEFGQFANRLKEVSGEIPVGDPEES